MGGHGGHGLALLRFDSDGSSVQDTRFQAPAPRTEAALKTKDIGITVRAIRTQLGLTTAGLGKKAGISQGQISRLENGRQGFRSGTLVKIAKALKVPPFRLFMTDAEWKRWSKRR